MIRFSEEEKLNVNGIRRFIDLIKAEGLNIMNSWRGWPKLEVRGGTSERLVPENSNKIFYGLVFRGKLHINYINNTAITRQMGEKI